MGMLSEFKEFAVKGNVMDMAIGVVVGGAFGKITTSLVGDVAMPVLGWLTAGVDFKKLSYTFNTKTPVVINYGMFIQTVIDFLIIAWVVFMFVKIINRLRRTAEASEVQKTETPS